MKWQLIHKACWAGDAAEVARLLDAGADPNQVAPTNWRQTPLGRALEFRISFPKHAGHVETVRELLRHGANPGIRSTTLAMTPYELASFCGLVGAADLLRDFSPATPHPTGMTGLWLAAASRLPEAVGLAAVRSLSRRRDVNLPWQQATPLQMAAGHAAHFHVADQLVKAGADPNAGTSLLHVHYHFEHLIAGLRYLAGVGWNVNSCDSERRTALHQAAFLGYSVALRTLLSLGADPFVKDSKGLTPLDLAHRSNKATAIRVLARI